MSPSQLERRKRLFELAATQGGYFTREISWHLESQATNLGQAMKSHSRDSNPLPPARSWVGLLLRSFFWVEV